MSPHARGAHSRVRGSCSADCTVQLFLAEPTYTLGLHSPRLRTHESAYRGWGEGAPTGPLCKRDDEQQHYMASACQTDHLEHPHVGAPISMSMIVQEQAWHGLCAGWVAQFALLLLGSWHW